MLPLDRRRFLLGSLATGAALTLWPRRRALAAPADLAAGLNRAGADLYRQLSSKAGNIFFSPLSIGVAFAMLEAGARGETRAEIDAVFGFGAAGVAEGCRELSRKLAATKGAEVSIANRLWGARDLVAERAFLEVTAKQFGAAMERVEFARNVEAAKKINRWVGKQTQGKITELVPASVLDDQTRLVLTNAIYFKGTWETAFKADATRPAPFARLGGDTVEAKLMYGKRKLAVAGDEDVQVGRFPYRGDLAMYVALPHAADGLPALEPKIDGARLAGWTKAAKDAPVREQDVWLPRFRARFRTSLPETLQALGMRQAFDPGRADLGGIAPRDREALFVSDALHEGFVDVNEEGTEAAAATAIMVSRWVSAEQRSFRADHPFFYWIRHEPTGTVLFAGRLVDPTLPA